MAVATLVKTIGTSSRQYSTLQAWEDAAPANLTTAEQWNAGTFVGTFTAGEQVTGNGLTNGKFLASNQSSSVAFGIVTGNSATLVTLTGTTSGATCIVSTKTHTGVIWRGEAYNDSEFSATVTISGETTSATCYVELTVAAGQSYQDQAGVRTNALTYNQSLGVGINTSSNSVNILAGVNYTRVSRFQISHTGTGVSQVITTTTSFITNCVFKDILVLSASTQASSNGNIVPGTSGMAINCLVILDVVTTGNAFGTAGLASGLFLGCTAIRPSNRTAGGIGFASTVGTTNIVQSCCSFGFTTCASATNWDTTNSKNNATEQASGWPGSNNQHSVTYNATTPFTQASSASALNLISIAGTSLAANGFLDATNGPLDISGFTRAASPTIGCWELDAAAGHPTMRRWGGVPFVGGQGVKSISGDGTGRMWGKLRKAA